MIDVTERWRSERVMAAVYGAGVKHDRVATVGACAMWGADMRLQDAIEFVRVLRPGGTLRGTSYVTGRGPRTDALIALLRRAGVFGDAPHAGAIERWLGEFGLDVVTLEPSGAVEFFEARLPFRERAES